MERSEREKKAPPFVLQAGENQASNFRICKYMFVSACRTSRRFCACSGASKKKKNMKYVFLHLKFVFCCSLMLFPVALHIRLPFVRLLIYSARFDIRFVG